MINIFVAMLCVDWIVPGEVQKKKRETRQKPVQGYVIDQFSNPYCFATMCSIGQLPSIAYN